MTISTMYTVTAFHIISNNTYTDFPSSAYSPLQRTIMYYVHYRITIGRFPSKFGVNYGLV